MSFGGGTTTTTEQSQTSFPQWTQDAQADTYSQGKGMLTNFLRNPQYQVAGFGSDSLKGFDLARDSARNVFEAAPNAVPAGGGNLTPAMGTAARANGAQLSPGEIGQFMNPFMGAVLDPTIARMRGERDNSAAAIGAKYAAQGGLGGSGDAIARGQLDRNFGESVATTTATLMAAGYDKATAAAMANAQMRQQTDMANAGFQQQTGLANQSAENAMRGLGLDYGLKQAQANDQFRTSQLAREQTALERVLQGGQMQEGKAQQALDIPWTALQRLMALTPQQMNSQTVSQKESPDNSTSPLQSLLGLGSTILGSKTAAGGSVAASLLGLSDEREKTDIQKLGKDPETGLQLYSYRYKGDPKTYPKMTGPMAQEVEEAYPGSTRDVGGRKAVPMNMLMRASDKKAA